MRSGILRRSRSRRLRLRSWSRGEWVLDGHRGIGPIEALGLGCVEVVCRAEPYPDA